MFYNFWVKKESIQGCVLPAAGSASQARTYSSSSPSRLYKETSAVKVHASVSCEQYAPREVMSTGGAETGLRTPAMTCGLNVDGILKLRLMPHENEQGEPAHVLCWNFGKCYTLRLYISIYLLTDGLKIILYRM